MRRSGIEEFAEELHGLGGGHVELLGEVGGGGELLAERVEASGLLGLGGALADDQRLAAAALEDAVALEEAVGLADRHRVEGELGGERAGRGEFGAGREQAGGDLEFDLVHDLPVGGHAVVEIDGEQGGHRIYDFGLPIFDWAEGGIEKVESLEGGTEETEDGEIWNSGNQERRAVRAAGVWLGVLWH